MTTHSLSLTLLPDNSQRLANLCGRLNEHIKQIESHLAVKIQQRGNVFQLSGSETAVSGGSQLLESLYRATAKGDALNPKQVHLALQEVTDLTASVDEHSEAEADQAILIKTPKGSVKPRSRHQREPDPSIEQHCFEQSRLAPPGPCA